MSSWAAEKGRKGFLLCLILMWMCLPLKLQAAEEQLLEDLGLQEIQSAVDELLGEDLDVTNAVRQAAGGESAFSPLALGERVREQLEQTWKRQKGTFLSALSLTLCAALLANFSGIFRNQQIAEVSFEITYMLLFLLLLRSFEQEVQTAREVLAGMQDFMRALIPAYFLSVSMAGSPVTAGVFYPFVLGLIDAVQWLIVHLLLPLLEGYVILVFVNHLTREEYLTQLSEVLTRGIGWILRTLLAVVTGFHVVQGILSPAVDSLKSTALSRAAAAVPGVGNLAGTVTDVLFGSCILIKNAVGTLGLVALMLICLAPLVQLGVWILMLELLAAAVQPVSDKRMVGCISGLAGAGRLLLRMVFTVAVLFMLTLALVAVTTGVRA